MRKKLQKTSGLTLVELLCAVVVLILLGLMLSAGMSMAMESYRNVIAASEVQLLLSTAADAVTDELRYAQEVQKSGDTVTYRSASYGPNTELKANDDGHIAAGGKELLPPGDKGEGGAYKGSAYKVEPLNITYDSTTQCFTVKLTVVWTEDDSIRAETEFTVRCLNGGVTQEEGTT